MAKEPYITESKRLENVVSILERRSAIIDCFHKQLVSEILNNTVGKRKQLHRLFEMCVNQRVRASDRKARTALRTFDKFVDKNFKKINKLVKGEKFDEANEFLFLNLCKIRNVGQKIAAFFIKQCVCYAGFWPELKPYLFVPLDRLVMNMLKNQLEAVRTIPTNAVYQRNNRIKLSKAYLDFQNELGAIARNIGSQRITFDGLWYVSFIWHQPYPICESCIIYKYCKKRRE